MNQGKELRRYMKKEGIKTQAELARKLGITDGYVCHYFKGIRSFSPKMAIKISKITGIPMRELYQ